MLMRTQDEAKLGEGRITDEGLAKLRSLIGTKLRISQQFL